MAHTCQLPGFDPPVTVKLTEDLDLDALLKFKAFNDWQERLKDNLRKQKQPGHTFESHPWSLREIHIHHVAMFATGKIGFMTIEAKLARDEEPRQLDRVVFLRGGSVAMLMILRPKDSRNERYVIMTEQPRIGAYSLAFLEIPAGMLDDSTEVRGKVIDEIREETGFTIQKDELIDLTALALRDAETRESVMPAMYPSPANLDEFIPLFLWEKELDRQEIEDLKGKLTGVRKQQEMITLRVCDYEVLWREGARDAKTLAAWALYEGLSREGKIKDALLRIRTKTFLDR